MTNFLETIAQPVKEKIDKWDFIKIKNLCPTKDNLMRVRRQAIDQEKKNATEISNKGLIFKIYQKKKQHLS